MEYVEELESVPEPEHVEQVMDGLIDTVSGTEGFTKAQYYLEGVLYSNGMIRHRDVGGTEGILSKVGDGVKAAIEYVKKLFKSIWDFFFKSDKKKMEEKVDKALDDAYKALDDLEKTNVTPDNVDQVLKKASTTANKIKDEPAKKKVQEKIKTAQEAPTPEAKVSAAKDIPEAVFKGWYINPSISGINAYSMKNTAEKLAELKKKADFDHAADIQNIINGLIGYPETVAQIDSIATAKKYLDKSKSCRTAVSNSLKPFENERDVYERMIKDIENAPKKENREELKKLKEGLVIITEVIGCAKSIMDRMHADAKQVAMACGEKA